MNDPVIQSFTYFHLKRLESKGYLTSSGLKRYVRLKTGMIILNKTIILQKCVNC